MFNYLKKYNIFCSSKLFVVLYAVCMFSISAEAKICFLPDSSCGTGKISSVKPDPAQCLYSSMAQAQNGMSSCEKAYKQNFCFYRRCKTREEDKNVFSNYSDCQKALEDNQTCQSCGGCYKIVTNANPTPKTCNETEATCSAKGKAFEANGEYDSNNVACGNCKVIETCNEGYSTAYQSQKDCKTGETFSSNGTANGKVCGKCTYQCSDYTLTSKKNENCYSCTPCPYDSSKYKCTESVKSDYQLVNGVCSKIPNTEPEPNPVACSSGYTAGLTSCTEKAGYTSSYTSDGYVGGKICGKCDYTARTCPNGYSTKYSSVSACGNTGSNGWNYASNGYSGEAVCGKCTAKACPNGYSTKYSSVSACGETGSEGWNYSTNGYSGKAVCGKCTAKACPNGHSCWSYRDSLLGESCNTNTRCPGDSGYYYFNGVLDIISTCSDSGYWAHVSGRCGDGICIKDGRLTCPNGGISYYDVDNVYTYCKDKNGAGWSARSMKNADGSNICTGSKSCYECYRRQLYKEVMENIK